eukprot:928197_1
MNRQSLKLMRILAVLGLLLSYISLSVSAVDNGLQRSTQKYIPNVINEDSFIDAYNGGRIVPNYYDEPRALDLSDVLQEMDEFVEQNKDHKTAGNPRKRQSGLSKKEELLTYGYIHRQKYLSQYIPLDICDSVSRFVNLAPKQPRLIQHLIYNDVYNTTNFFWKREGDYEAVTYKFVTVIDDKKPESLAMHSLDCEVFLHQYKEIFCLAVAKWHDWSSVIFKGAIVLVGVEACEKGNPTNCSKLDKRRMVHLNSSTLFREAPQVMSRETNMLQVRLCNSDCWHNSILRYITKTVSNLCS